MTRAKSDDDLIQFSHWVSGPIVLSLRAEAKRLKRRQRSLIEEALCDLLAKLAPASPAAPDPRTSAAAE